MTKRLAALIAAGVLLASVRPLAAQRLRGDVVLPDSTTPASGAIVVATGDGGALVRRALSNEHGAFSLALPHAGRFELRVLRIGFAPTVLPDVDIIAGETRSMHIVARGDPIALPKVTVRGRDECGASADTRASVAHVWEDAREALIAAQLVGEGPLIAEWIEFDRTLDPVGSRVRDQRVRVSRGAAVHVFRSRPADSLADGGYIVDDAGVTRYYAPDADVLLSASFAATHCFHIEPAPAGHDGLVGMGFTPARPRVEVKDIVGTFWVDRASGELRWLEYRYTNVTAAAEHAGVGGRVEFLRLKSGEWFVSRWNILTATLGTAPTANANDASRNMLLASSEPPLKTLQVSGGEVSTLSRGDSLLYRTAGLALTLQVVSHDSIVPVAGASISLTGTDYSARADASGTARIAPVLTGQYHVSVHSALMDSLGAAPVERDVEVRDGVARIDSIALPAAADLLRASCRGEALGKNESMLRGTVRDSLGHGVRNAAVTVAPLSDPAKGGDGEGAIGVLTDGLGHWRLCGIRRGVSLAVRVETDDGGDARTLRLDESLPFAMADLVVRRPKASTDNAPAEPAGGSAKSKSALVEISVSMRNGVPLADAVVQLVPRSGPARTVKTSETGHALVAAVDAGVILVRTRGSSFKAGELSALVAPGRNTVPLVVGATTLPTLGGARMIGGTRVLARQEGFEARRWNHEASASITAGEIEQRHPAQTWQLLQSVASIDIREAQQNGTVTVLAASRQQRSQTTQSSELCYVKVMVDGVVLQADDPTTGQLNLVNLPPPATIHGLEVFAAGTSGPPEFRGADASRSCGLIAIWLK